MAGVTIGEIRKLVDSYQTLEGRYNSDTSPRGLTVINREIDQCVHGDGVASVGLRSMTQVLKLCIEEGRARKTSTGELLSLAVDYHLGGHDPAKALKRARNLLQSRTSGNA